MRTQRAIPTSHYRYAVTVNLHGQLSARSGHLTLRNPIWHAYFFTFSFGVQEFRSSLLQVWSSTLLDFTVGLARPKAVFARALIFQVILSIATRSPRAETTVGFSDARALQ